MLSREASRRLLRTRRRRVFATLIAAALGLGFGVRPCWLHGVAVASSIGRRSRFPFAASRYLTHTLVVFGSAWHCFLHMSPTLIKFLASTGNPPSVVDVSGNPTYRCRHVDSRRVRRTGQSSTPTRAGDPGERTAERRCHECACRAPEGAARCRSGLRRGRWPAPELSPARPCRQPDERRRSSRAVITTAIRPILRRASRTSPRKPVMARASGKWAIAPPSTACGRRIARMKRRRRFTRPGCSRIRISLFTNSEPRNSTTPSYRACSRCAERSFGGNGLVDGMPEWFRQSVVPKQLGHRVTAVPCSSSMRVVTPVATMVRVASTDAYVQKMSISSESEAFSK